MKPSRDKKSLARQHALGMYRAPNASRFAMGQILLMFEAGAVRWADRTLRGLSNRQRGIYWGFGTSMAPTVDPTGSITGKMYGIKRAVAPSALQRGMFATFVSHTGTDYGYGKRIIALPGDIVRTRSDCVHNRYVKIPPGFLWIEGDAGARKSYDSNQFGPIAVGNCTGVVHHIVYPFRYWGRVQWHGFRDQIVKERIVTDPKQLKALEAKQAHQLEFVAEWKEEDRIIKNIIAREGRNTRIDDLAAASTEKTVQFLREASVKRAQMRAAKAKVKVASASGKPDDFLLEQWRTRGGYLRVLEKDVVVIILPTSISEDDRRVLEKKAQHAKAKTGCSYQFEYIN
ncbi:hypothetical protein PG985_002316 [Apiospora marii]|uniref:Peptidase S26 domain-containing protein n=1 Tax=Apiospora marii TaxID=335849 RepID=A0ABR1RTP6_9PEZI